jgi:hypothetical protein
MSKFRAVEKRNQMQFFCLEQVEDQDNEVRLIELFVHALHLKDFGFKSDFVENGRPAYHPADFSTKKNFLSGKCHFCKTP